MICYYDGDDDDSGADDNDDDDDDDDYDGDGDDDDDDDDVQFIHAPGQMDRCKQTDSLKLDRCFRCIAPNFLLSNNQNTLNQIFCSATFKIH